MVKLEKKQVKIVSVLIALAFIGSVVALALTQSGSDLASAASSSVGVIDYQAVASQSPKVQELNKAMQQEEQNAQKDFEEKSAGMNDQEKAEYYQQTMQRLQQKAVELREPVVNDINDAVKKVAEAKGLQVVLEKTAVVYGGQDITQDVVSKLSK